MDLPDFNENDLRAIERARDLPPDEPYPHGTSRLPEDAFLGGEVQIDLLVCPACDSRDFHPCGDHDEAGETFECSVCGHRMSRY